MLRSTSTPILLFEAVRDLARLRLPLRAKNRHGFAFIVHPRTEEDAARRYPFARYLGKRTVGFWIKHFWPVLLSEVSGVTLLKDGTPIPGWILICPLTARQMIEDRKLALARVTETVKLAEKYGADIIGLGGLTSSVTRGGTDLLDKTSATIVTGRALTPVIVSRYVTDALVAAGIDLGRATVAVVGAAGGIGSGTTVLLTKAGARNFILIDLERKGGRLQELKEKIGKIYPASVVEISHQIGRVKDARVIVTATNSPEALVESDDVSPGTIIVDDAQPSDIHPDIFTREDVVVISGGIIKVPGILGRIPLRFSELEENFSCFGEVVTLAAHGKKEHFSLGFPKEKELAEIEKLAQDIRITRGNFQNHTRTYTDEDVRKIAGAKP